MKKFHVLILLLFSSLVYSQNSKVDSVKKVIQFSGIITEGDSLYGIPGAAVISLSSGVGVNSNMMGYFSMPVFEGDSVLIAAIGFRKRSFKIPTSSGYSYSVMIALQLDTILLPEVVLHTFPSEEVFKEVLLSMKLNDEVDYQNMQNNLNVQIMDRMMAKAEVPASSSFRYYMDRQANAMQRKYVVTMNPLTDPFAWARFLKEVQAQKERKEKEAKDKNSNKNY